MPERGQYGTHSGTHYGGSTLWQKDREAVWAINARTRHFQSRGRPPIGQRWRLYGCLVVVSAVNQPYGMALRSRANSVYHLADRVCLVWRGGVLLGGQVMWLCGSVSEQFRLMSEPPPDRPLCSVCEYQSGRWRSVTVNIGQVVVNGSH